jgi:hypothetical protein
MVKRKQYDRQSAKLWLDPISGAVSDNRISPNCIRFDSRAEYNLYVKLSVLKDRFNFDLYKDCPIVVGSQRWVMDFKLVFDDLGFVRYFIESAGYRIASVSLPILYIEYKGVLNDKAESKLDALFDDDKNAQTIILSDKCGAYCKECFSRYTVATKPILSVDFFIAMLYDKFLKYSKEKYNVGS